MRSKKLIAAMVASSLTILFSLSAFAGQWQWIDDNLDGIAECYYFDDSGNMLRSTTTPDGYKVNSDGQWHNDYYVYTKSSVLEEMAENPNPTSEDIVKYLSVVTDNVITSNRRNGYNYTKDLYKQLEVDYSKEPSTSGVTNVKIKRVNDYISTSGWYYLPFYSDSFVTDVCLVAFDEGGYLYVNSTTPDGLYVNEYGMLEVDGRPVIHTTECRIFPPSSRSTTPLTYADGTAVTDKNNVDLSRMGDDLYYQLVSMSLYTSSNVPFGDAVYRHPDFVGISDSGHYIYEYKEGFGNCVEEEERSLIDGWSKPLVSGVKISFN